ncbi:hypothetical protein O6H91_05G125300 [Diphasiastrum complanatum]|uniref:Uncharacterized protein n=1 Tax=Diphasiastrum complanatum TaxID=34168 RepID=A0ACC2DTT0_DIPCM|nr:hypothetical protein O6H91_Y268600 [Diphasiastrum complanatum]KAJ7557402.1 hypothetical protein O6H91_05G125300 [Diphasiastrum complanatum]
MSKTILQPVGQKRLTNIAVVRLKKHGNRFEIACYKNKVLSWRSQVEKDIDEVLQSHIVYANVSKGVLAKSKDLMEAFGTSDEEKVCLEILEKGDLQVAGKEREVQLSNQFRDIATIVMDKTVNPETERPYTISMIERLMREVHFAVDPHKSSKQQALELIKDLQKQFPLKRAHMRLRLVVPATEGSKLVQMFDSWNAQVDRKEETGGLLSVFCQVEPGRFRDCDGFVRDLHGRVEVISMSVQKDEDANDYDFLQDIDWKNKDGDGSASMAADVSGRDSSTGVRQTNDILFPGSHNLTKAHMEKSEHLADLKGGKVDLVRKKQKCLSCDAVIEDPKEFREHYKSDWHKHNLKRKLKSLPPLSWEECLADTDIIEKINDINDYSR